MSEPAAEGTETKASGGGGSKLPLLLLLLNALGVIGVLGALVYTRIIYKRPKITETTEKPVVEKIEKASPPPPAVRVTFPFDALTITLEKRDKKDGSQAKKEHYAQIAFVFEIRSEKDRSAVEESKPIILDEILSLVSKMKFEELATVHGRYVLRNEIIDRSNEVIGDSVVLNLYFTQFSVQ